MSSRLAFAIVLSLLLPSMLSAQLNRRGMQGAGQQMQTTDIKGVVQDCGKAGLIISDSNNKTWHVFTSGNLTKWHVTGTLSPNQLKAGMLAELNGEFDADGKLTKSVDALTITTSTGSHAGSALGGNEGGKHAGAAAKASTHLTGSSRVVGRLSVARNGNLSIQAGRQKVPFKLSSDAKIDVDMTDYSLVTRGSAITVTGVTSPARPGFVQATEVNVELGADSGMGGLDAGGPAKGLGGKAPAKKPAKKPAAEDE